MTRGLVVVALGTLVIAQVLGGNALARLGLVGGSS